MPSDNYLAYVNAPTRPGLYWARDFLYAEWSMIVKVTGQSPFCKMECVSRPEKVKTVPYRHEDCSVSTLIFGPEIIAPEI